jgi:hypothetical protein
VFECVLICQQYQQATGLTPVRRLKSSEQCAIEFGECLQGTLADVIGQLIYPLEIIQDTLSLDVRQGLDGGFEAGQQFDRDHVPIEGFRESDIPLFEIGSQVRRPNMTQKARQAEAHAPSHLIAHHKALWRTSYDCAECRYAQARVHPPAFVQSRKIGRQILCRIPAYQQATCCDPRISETRPKNPDIRPD